MRRRENYIVGAFSESNRTFIVFDADYRAKALFASGNHQFGLEIIPSVQADLERIMNTTEAIDLSTILTEALHFLNDVTKALKDRSTHRIIVALDPVQRIFMEFNRSEFERVR